MALIIQTLGSVATESAYLFVLDVGWSDQKNVHVFGGHSLEQRRPLARAFLSDNRLAQILNLLIQDNKLLGFASSCSLPVIVPAWG